VPAGRDRGLRDSGAPRITALVAFDDGEATVLWQAVGYVRDRDIGSMVRTL
jgi:hypothetical protein